MLSRARTVSSSWEPLSLWRWRRANRPSSSRSGGSGKSQSDCGRNPDANVGGRQGGPYAGQEEARIVELDVMRQNRRLKRNKPQSTTNVACVRSAPQGARYRVEIRLRGDGLHCLRRARQAANR